jgi:hypothetical protein
MARATGLEPAASGVTGRRSNQLSYARSPNTHSAVASIGPRQRAITRRSFT